MRHIEEIYDTPESVEKWLTANKADILKKVDDDSVSGDQLWSMIKNDKPVYDDLKEMLVKNQGYICCYCGRRIKSDHHTTIEHIKPKHDYKRLTYDLKNLAASCNGSSDNIIHLVEGNESILDISLQYDVPIEYIQETYVNLDVIKQYKFIPDIEKLSPGDRILIHPKENKGGQHCDTHKGGDEIDITPKMKNVSGKFLFTRLTGKILVTNENRKTVSTLGLNNNSFINSSRQKAIIRGIKLKRLLLTRSKQKYQISSDLLKISKKYNIVSADNPRLRSFSFVTYDQLK